MKDDIGTVIVDGVQCTNQLCSTCRFWAGSPGNAGECRRQPRDRRWVEIITEHDFWCGEWLRKLSNVVHQAE